jgi:pimeloyl-ACP methyl ester carboxylesterase
MTRRRIRAREATARAPQVLFACALLALPACAPPIRVKQVSEREAYTETTSNALSSGHASEWARTTANEWGLLGVYDEKPAAALAELREIVVAGRGGRRELFALAELSYEHAEQGGGRPFHLASAVWAYAFLFASSPERGEHPLDPLDPRTRLAADLYNRALAAAFRAPERGTIAIEAGLQPLPFGEIELRADPAQLLWGDRRLVDLAPVSEMEIVGLRNRHLLAGIGAALSAGAVPREGVDLDKSLIAPFARIGATLVLRIDDVRAGIASGHLQGQLDLYPASDSDTTTIEGQQVALEIDETAPLAVMLAGSPLWKQELWGFFGRNAMGVPLPILASLEPYRPGRIPVVFVHGTESSPARWADMANDLLADSWIRRHYQFWYFAYDSGSPIPYSALLLREKLAKTIAQLDPDGRDACLRDMVVVGHSQGGLLTKMTAIRSGDRLWEATFRVPVEEVPVPARTRELLRRGLFVEPLPFVRRLVFVATPHRGSFLTGRFLNGVIRRLVRLPSDLASLTATIASAGSRILQARSGLDATPTAVDNMTPGNPFLSGLAGIEVEEGVPFHSIVAVEEKFPVVEQGNDGVVEYTSAHLDGAASELVVRSPHSCQAEPNTIQETRRILLLHGRVAEQAGLPCGPPARD